jgi:hypothetical protein
MPHTPQPSPPPLTLLPQQSRLINATEGFRLEVQSGCLWLTRPSDCVDRFLVVGSSIELHENHVLIQSDTPHRAGDITAARYTLTPLQVPAAAQPVASGRAISKGKSSSQTGLQPLWGLRKQLFN